MPNVNLSLNFFDKEKGGEFVTVVVHAEGLEGNIGNINVINLLDIINKKLRRWGGGERHCHI